MKRELAALEETKSPVLDSAWRKTRSSTRSSGVALSGSLVYKRVKKSQVKKAELSSNGANVVVGNVSRASEAVSHPNGVHEARNESENGLLQVEKRESGVAAALSSEVVKEVCDEEVKKLQESRAIEEKVKKLQESRAIEEKVVNDCSLAANDALPRNVIVMGVAAVNGLIKNAKSDVVELKSGSAVEEGATKGGSVEAGNELHANGGSIDVDKDKVVEGVSKKSRLTVVNGNAKSSSVERHPMRFTRSALKLGFVENEPVTIEPNKLAIVVYQSPESREEVKDSSAVKYTRRLTRSASKFKADGRSLCSTENVTQEREKTMPAVNSENAQCDMDTHSEEPSTSTPRRKLEMKMSKQISLAKKIPTNVQELFATGMLEGCPVYYDGGKGRELYGRIRGVGILCSCGICKGIKVIPPSLFEIHACNSYKRAVQYIYLENGRSLIQILKTCKRTRLDTLEATIKNAIGPLPEKKVLVCQNCKESFSTMDAGSSEPVCSTCVMSNLSPVGPVYSSRKRCRSPKIISPCQAASTCAMSQDDSVEKPVEKLPEAFCTPKLKTSQVGVPSDLLQGRRRSKSVEKSADKFVTPTLRRSSRFESISETKSSEEIVKNPEEASMVPKTCSSPVLGSSKAKRSKKLKERSFKSALSTKPSKATRLGKSSPENDGGKATERLKKEILAPKPSKTPSVLKSSEKKTNGKITRKDLRLHKLVFEDDVLPEGTELGYYARGKKLLDGFKKGSGIYCNCCDTVVSASQFEAHAGCASRRKPYCYIYTSNGVSLHELSVTLIKDRRHTAKYNDDLCSICADGGSLLLCDGCPRAFHKECASLPSIPVGKWYCKYCQNMFEREKFVAHNANAVAAGRVSGVDSIEQINKRSIRIVNNLASEVSACILCRAYDFCKSGFGPRTIILCDQCEKEYHVGCLKDHNMADLTELPEGKWFCNMDCGRIESSLQNLLVRGVEKLPESFLDIIRKKSMQISSDSGSDLDVRWRLLSGKVASPETRTLLSQAVAIFHESFSPIIDVVSGHDLIPAMVYGRNVGGQEYGGMYCAVLTVNSVVVSAGIFRIFGPEIVEIPLVATSSGNHGKGYFQILFACIEKLLAFLKIKTIVLPAAEEAGSIWTDRFGFTKMTADELCELKKNFWSIVRFQGTSMLHKLVPQSPVTES